MEKNYDAIVIGAGNGGLSAAAMLAKYGKRVLLVEKHNLPGGSATSFVRGRFEFETSLHEMAQVGTKENPGALRNFFNGINLDVDWQVDTAETFRFICPEEGIDADMPGGVQQFVGKMEQLVPGSAPSMMQFIQLAMEAAKGASFLVSPEYTPEAMDAQFPHFMTMAGHSIKEVLTAIGMPEKAQHILSTYWCYLGATEEEMDFATYAMMTLAYIAFGAAMPKERSHEMSLAFEKVIRDNRGEVWYNTAADKILVKDGKAYGVVIDGKEYYAREVISSAYPNYVYGRMMDPAEVPEEALKLTNNREIGLSFVTVYLGMNKTPEELGITSYSNFVATTSDSVKQKENATNTCEYSGYAIMNCLNKVIPDCTPEGTCQLFFTTFFFGNGWDNLTPKQYVQQKEKVAKDMIAHVEKAMGITLTPYIEEIEIAAPATFARYLGTPQGTPYGYQMNVWDNYMLRKAVKEKEKYIENLQFVGASSAYGDGYSTAILSGIDAAQHVLAKDRAGKEIKR